MQKLGLYVSHASIPVKIKDSGKLAFISLYFPSFIPLLGARSSRRLWAVSSHLPRRWQGMDVPGPQAAGPRSLSVVLKAETAPGAGPGLGPGQGPGPGPSGRPH